MPIVADNIISFNGPWAGNGNPVGSNLQIFVNDRSPCDMGGDNSMNGAVIFAVLYAPTCDLTFKNQATWTGSLFVKNFISKNQFTFVDSSSGGGVTGGDDAPFYLRQLWMECKKTAPPSDPESGCT